MTDSRFKKILDKEMTRKDFIRFLALAFISLFGVVGVVTEILSHASTPYVSEEAESGKLTGPATLTTDSQASGGKAVTFGTASGSGSGGSPFAIPYPFSAASSVFAKTVAQRNLSVVSNSATMVANLCKAEFGGINTFPVVRVPSTQSSVPLSGGTNPSTGTSIQMPLGIDLNTSGDGPLACWVYSGTQAVWELWQVVATGNGYSISDGGKLTDLATSTGVFTSYYGLSATGISYLATMITQNDVLSGSIKHAIPLMASTINAGFVPPAIRQDSNSASHPGYIPEGSYMYLPSSATLGSGACPLAEMVFTALKTYGMYCTDQTQNSGYNMIQAESNTEWVRQGQSGTDPITKAMNGLENYQLFGPIPWSSLQVLTPSAT